MHSSIPTAACAVLMGLAGCGPGPTWLHVDVSGALAVPVIRLDVTVTQAGETPAPLSFGPPGAAVEIDLPADFSVRVNGASGAAIEVCVTAVGAAGPLGTACQTRDPILVGEVNEYDVTLAPAGDCGNGAVDAGEDCDGTELGGASCETMGFEPGVLACTAGCTFDVTGCPVPAGCGDGVIDSALGEMCEGLDLGGADCIGLGHLGGPLQCNGACQFDQSACWACVPGTTECAPDGRTLEVCGVDGLGLDPGLATVCGFVCEGDACRYASNVPESVMLACDSTAPLVFDGPGTVTTLDLDVNGLPVLDPATGGPIAATLVPQPGGAPDLAVFCVSNFAAHELVLATTSPFPWPVVLVSDASIDITVGIDLGWASSAATDGNPGGHPGGFLVGGGAPGEGPGGGGAGVLGVSGGGETGSGGGGGGLGGTGGSGGASNGGMFAGGSSGLASAAVDLVPLDGGSGGGGGASQVWAMAAGGGGAGGGAIHLVARATVSLAAGAYIDAGGEDGDNACSPAEGGGGGGSGGAVLLEAPSVLLSMSALIYVTGGDGGGSAGGGCTAVFTMGGAGATTGLDGAPGEMGGLDEGGGGGGGAAGLVRVNATTGADCTPAVPFVACSTGPLRTTPP